MDFRSIPGVAGLEGALKRYYPIVQPFFFCASNHSIEPVSLIAVTRCRFMSECKELASTQRVTSTPASPQEQPLFLISRARIRGEHAYGTEKKNGVNNNQ